MASEKTPTTDSNREKSAEVPPAPLPTPPTASQSNMNSMKHKSNKVHEMTILTTAMELNPWQHATSSRRVRYDEVSKVLFGKGINAPPQYIQVLIDRKLIQYYKYRSDPNAHSSYISNKPREFLAIMTKIASFFSQLEMRRKKVKHDTRGGLKNEDSHSNDNHYDLSDSTAPSSPEIIEPSIPSRRRRSIVLDFRPHLHSEYPSTSQGFPPLTSSSHSHGLPPPHMHASITSDSPHSTKLNHFPAPPKSSSAGWPSSYAASSNMQFPPIHSQIPIQPKPHVQQPPTPTGTSTNNTPSVPSMSSRPSGNHNCCHHDCHKLQAKLFTPLKEFLEKKLEWDHAKLERENWRHEKQLEIENQQRARQMEIDREIRLREVEQRTLEVQLDRQVMEKFFKMMGEFMDQVHTSSDHQSQPQSAASHPRAPANRPPAAPAPGRTPPNPHSQPSHHPSTHPSHVPVVPPSKPAPAPHPPTHPSQLPSHPHHSHHHSR